MYCSKHGNMVSNDLMFYNKGSARIGMWSGGTVMKSERDSEVFKPYLQDLLALECIKKKYFTSINTETNTIT